MKKLFGGMSLVALMLVCLTGCGSSSLKCTGTVDDIEASAKATLKGDKVTKVVMESTEITDSEEEAKQYAALYNGFGSLGAESGYTVSAKASGKKVTMTATIDITKMSSEEIEDEFGSAELTKDAFVKAMEEEGLTCK